MTKRRKTAQVFNPMMSVAPLGIIAMDGAKELGTKINDYLVTWARQSGQDIDTFLIKCKCPRFQTGDAKAIIEGTVRGTDLFIICDPGNYSCTYPLFGNDNHMSPDDHYQDLKRIIQAAGGKAHRINVIMPMLYGGRQHRRNYRESLDCAWMLQELMSMGVENILTFDAHDPRVQNAVPLMGFDNIIPSYQVLKTLIHTVDGLEINKDSFMVVSPDEGAISRNMYYASVLKCDLGMFYKRRDYSVIVNGRNPIVAHEYLGNDVSGKDIFIADDMISSGDSVMDIAKELKARNARRIFAYATYPIFTNGVEAFNRAHAEGLITGVYGTNLSYLNPALMSCEWFHAVDCSKYASYFVAALNHDMSVSEILDPHEKITQLLREHSHITG